jgi:S1-C subfamily serine protease
VIQDSPAFKANILEGDIIIQIADKPVTTAQDFVADLSAYAGQKVPIKLIRNGQTIDIDVQLNEATN